MSPGILSRPAPKGGLVLRELDALRGVAILSVFAQHLGDPFRAVWEPKLASLGAASPWLLTIAHHAWWGVDLFFVVSGFSLALGYLRAFDEGRSAPPALEFWKRRASRILPAYAVAIAVVLAHRTFVFGLPGFPAAMAAHALLLQGYVAPGGITLIGASWSLTTEAHFYLLMPLLAGPILKARAYIPGLVICAAVWISRAILHALVLEPGVYSGLFELTQRRLITSRLDQFVLGMLAAMAFVDLRRSRLAKGASRAARFALVFLAGGLVLAFRLEGELFLRPVGAAAYAILSLVTASIVLAACLSSNLGEGDQAGRASGARSIVASPFAAIGVVSYGVFLYHELAIGLARWLPPIAKGGPSWGALGATAIVALSASVLAGAVSWVVVERPFLRGARGEKTSLPSARPPSAPH